LKVQNYNGKGSKNLKHLKCGEMLEYIKATYGHASKNMLKKSKTMIDGIPNSKTQLLLLTSG
jgi:hypothetical protein